MIVLTMLMYFIVVRFTPRKRFKRDLPSIDRMDGLDFEKLIGAIYEDLGYKVEVTKASGDFGADVLTLKNGEITAIQCKRYSNLVGITAVQEVTGAIAYYKAHKGAVITNNYYTEAAKTLAKVNHIELIDRKGLENLLKKCNTF